MEVEICVNTNNYDRKEVWIDHGTIEEFTKNAFLSGSCQAVVKFECLPAAVDPNAIRVFIKVLEDGIHIVGDIFTIKEVVKLIITFFKKCHGYERMIFFDSSPDIIDVTDETTEEELYGKVLAVLEKQEKELGKNVKDIISENV